MLNDNEENMNELSGSVIEWTVHPVKRNPKRSVLVTIFILVVSAVVYSITSSPFFCILSLLFLFGSLGKFYFPTSYRLTEQQIIVKTRMQTLAKDWTAYRSSYPDKNGVLISPFPEPTRLENFRGLYLMTDKSNRDEVIAFVGHCLVSQSSESGTSDAAPVSETDGN